MPEKMSDVIVLLPGILGSELAQDGRVIWGWSGRVLARNLLSAGRAALDELGLGIDARGPAGERPIVATRLLPDLHLIPGLWKIDGYDAVSSYLQAEFDLTAGQNYFEFPYDWRRDNRESARELKACTDRWLHRWRTTQQAGARLILVAHSMGGLVARYFLEVLDGWRDTRALVTFGTPFRGSLNAVDAIANGIDVAGLADVAPLVRRLPSVYQLLPIYPCLRVGGDRELRRVVDADLPHAEPARVRDAFAFHDEIRTAVEAHQQDEAYRDRDHGYRVYPIVGYRQRTHQSGRVVPNGVELSPDIDGNLLGGDGTVPRPSAFPLEQHDAAAAMFASTRHARLQNADAVLDHLGGLLSSLGQPLGMFRASISRRTQVSLEVDDAYASGEPVVVRASTTRAGVAVGARFVDVDSGLDVARMPMTPTGDGWHRVEFRAPRAGAYRVFVSGNGADVEPASDVFEVVAADPGDLVA